jgi:pyoverdine/dityrosine biosynthesis protein Dit1
MRDTPNITAPSLSETLDEVNSPADIARLALATVLKDRRIATPTCPLTGICDQCISPHIDKLTEKAEEREPLQFMMLAFPSKSANPTKVLGVLPDMAEIISLDHINGWTARIGAFYEPGAEIIIGADGRAFADLVEVSDENVTSYADGILKIITDSGLSITYVGIDDLMPDLSEREDYDGLRDALTGNAVSIESLHRRAQEDPNFAYQVNGITRFLEEDLRWAFPSLSRKKLNKIARSRAYTIIQRGDALRAELESRFPQAARLSVHPQKSHSNKLGVHITPYRHNWRTPWHSAAVFRGKEDFTLMQRHEAEKIGAVLVYFANGQPSHFDATKAKALEQN